jgi:archaellum component FlaF (FlaF/FlaG flagellin family)
MKVQIASRTGAGSTTPFVMNTNTTPFNVGFGVIVTGTVDYTVQHTFDDPAVGFTTWFPHPTIAAQATNKDGNYAFPVTAIRITVNSGGGTVTFKLIQAGIA